MSLTISAQATKESWKDKFVKASDEYLDQVYLRYQPTQGTLAGYHQYDTQLEDYSRKNMDSEIIALKASEKSIEAIPTEDATAEGDREVVLGSIRSRLLTLETIQIGRAHV